MIIEGSASCLADVSQGSVLSTKPLFDVDISKPANLRKLNAVPANMQMIVDKMRVLE